MAYRFPFPAFPIGWFRLLASDELAPGQVKGVRAFGQELAVFRGRSGRVTVLEPHCPHLGAPLSLGKVNGDTLECRFHGWRYDGEGACVHAPGLKKIPPKARAGAWPVRELNGAIMVWHHPEGAAPTWEFPHIPEFANPDWYVAPGPTWPKIRTHVQEFAENGMDLSHFSYLHAQQTKSADSLGVEIHGPEIIHRTYQRYNLFALAKLFVDEVGGPLDVHAWGLGCAIDRTTVHAKIDLKYTFCFYFMPIDEEHVKVTSTLGIERQKNPLVTRLLWWKAYREGRYTLDQDVPIWEGKAYQHKPALGEHDGPIATFRRWARQFYPEGASPAVGLSEVGS